MELVVRNYVPPSALNVVGIASGTWLFEVADYAGVTYLNDLFVNDLPNGIDLVTVSSELKFKNGLTPSGTVSGYVELVDISRSKITVNVKLEAHEYKSRIKKTVLTGQFKFTLVNRDTLKIAPIPKDIVEKYKHTT